MHVEISASRLPKAPNSLFVALGVGDADGEVEDRADAALPPEALVDGVGGAGVDELHPASRRTDTATAEAASTKSRRMRSW